MGLLRDIEKMYEVYAALFDLSRRDFHCCKFSRFSIIIIDYSKTSL
jgi:hypothetical protein